MNIVLGIFSQPHFKTIAFQEGNCAYPFTELVGDLFLDVIEIVHSACLVADKIIFIIDGIGRINPFSQHTSVTCKELFLIINHPNNELVNKVIWMEDNQIVTKERVAEKLNIPISSLGDTK